MTDETLDVLGFLLTESRSAGCDSADALLVRDRSVTVEVRNRALEHVERSESAEVGLRVLVGRRQSCVSSSDTSREVLSRLARQAVEMAREAPEDPCAGLATADQIAGARSVACLELQDQAPEPPVDALIGRAMAAEGSALAVEGVSMVESASSVFGSSSIALAATNGFRGGHEKTYSGCSCAAIAGEDLEMEVDHYGELRVFGEDLSSSDEIGRKAGERAVERFRPSRPRTGAFPAVYDERVASSLIGHLLSAINGTAVSRGASWLRNSMGDEVLPEGVSLVEQPLRRRSISSRSFDAEGLPQREKSFVASGVLRSWVLDLATARKLGLESTGNAFRSISSPPTPGVTNIEITQGNKSRDELAAEMGTGLIITTMIGSTINPTTGDYSRGAGGLWVENGRITGPVSGFTVAGNLKRMLRSIVPGNDARPFASYRVPSLLVEGLVIAGD